MGHMWCVPCLERVVVKHGALQVSAHFPYRATGPYPDILIAPKAEAIRGRHPYITEFMRPLVSILGG